MTWHLHNEEAHLSGASPGVRLEGTEGSAKDLKIRENAGHIEIYDLDIPGVVVVVSEVIRKGTIVVRIADISAVESLYIMMPKCTVTNIWSVLSGAIALGASPTHITADRNGVALTNGQISIAVPGAAGDIDTCAPTANNTFDGATQYLKLVTDGLSVNVIPVLVTVEFTYTD